MQGMGDALLEDAGTAQVARPGTSLARPAGSAEPVSALHGTRGTLSFEP
jgi:16S rRNA C1402 (ribose-2'-O) methylase RsmI